MNSFSKFCNLARSTPLTRRKPTSALSAKTTQGERVRGKRGGGAKGRHIVFDLIKRGENVDTQVASNFSVEKLYPIIRSKVSPDSTIYTDGFKTYDGLVDFGYQKHYRIQHGNNESVNSHNHVSGIENLWGWAEIRPAKFRGTSRKTFYLQFEKYA